jgi:Zn-dependent metalloprotease
MFHPSRVHSKAYIIEKGTEEQKRRAWQSLILTEQLRGRRNVAGSLYTLFAVADKMHRTIFDAKNSESLPGNLVRSEGGKSKGGRPVNEAYDYSGDTYNFYRQVFDRNSVDSKGIRSMKEPGRAYHDPTIGKDSQPAHMKDYVNTSSDNGGVHALPYYTLLSNGRTTSDITKFE